MNHTIVITGCSSGFGYDLAMAIQNEIEDVIVVGIGGDERTFNIVLQRVARG